MTRTFLSTLFGAVVALAAVGAAAQTASAPAPAPATGKKTEDQHRRDDIAKHRQMASAHEAAAKCLEAGEKEAVCQERLREACKGIAVGRYCGMRHSH